MRRRALIVAIGIGFTVTASATPTPDFSGELRDGLRVNAWLNDSQTRGFLRVNETTSQLYRMWKATVADLDGDGTREIVLGVWSDAPRHKEPQPHRTVWVVSWDDEQQAFVERWRGSALARPLRDFRIENERLVALERADSNCFETTYSWTGFGFHGTKTARIPCTE